MIPSLNDEVLRKARTIIPSRILTEIRSHHFRQNILLFDCSKYFGGMILTEFCCGYLDFLFRMDLLQTFFSHWCDPENILYAFAFL